MAVIRNIKGDFYTIYKYDIAGSGAHRAIGIDLPVAAKLLSVKMQDGRITLWAAVDPDIKTETRKFWVLGTGWGIPKGIALVPLDTVIDAFGYVWHVFVEADIDAR